MTNRLSGETSPYLLQHAHNPVDWYPWGDEALERAVREDKPILLSIGYSVCHWCHVMERECFENRDIARRMNEDFINIKVDREERPDLDAVYMEAVQAITGSGGWPLTVFLTPEKKPFYGGTYFPPDDRQGLPGFPRVLETVAQAYRTRKGDVQGTAEQVIAHLKKTAETGRTADPLTTSLLSRASSALTSVFDGQNGGFGPAPKFPQPMTLEFLLRYHHRTGDRGALSMVERTLERMARGGIYDQIGGGFHRYSVDAGWQVPHFEKMLYDNALLSRLYLHGYQATGKQLYRRIAEETLDYVLREMTSQEGGFYSAQDADSEGGEGTYYLWTQEEVMGILGRDDGELAARHYGITQRGNFEGGNILSRPAEPEALASELGLATTEIESRIALAKGRLLERRAQRVEPGRDEKILADWNGLMLASLAEAASAFDQQYYLRAAISNATFLTTAMRDGNGWKHAYIDGRAKINGFLADYALVCQGMVALYQATLQEQWLRAALDLGAAMLERFWDESRACFFDTGQGEETLLVRPRNIYDNAQPSGSAAASFALLLLARLTGNADYERIAAASIRPVGELMAKYPTGFGHWLCALDFYLSEQMEIVLAGPPEDPATKSLVGVVSKLYLPNKVVAGGDSERPARSHDVPLLQGKTMIGNMPTAYVCRNHVCAAPVTDADSLATLLSESRCAARK